MEIVKFEGPYNGYNIFHEAREDVYSVVVADNAIEMQLCAVIEGHLETLYREMLLPNPVQKS